MSTHRRRRHSRPSAADESDLGEKAREIPPLPDWENVETPPIQPVIQDHLDREFDTRFALGALLEKLDPSNG